MPVYSVYIINKAGSLIYNHDAPNASRPAIEKTFSFPLELALKVFDEKVIVSFGERDGIKVGHAVLGINGVPADGRCLKDRRDILEVLGNVKNYPINIKFGRPPLSTNEKIMLASMLHSLFAIGSQLSPELRSSGIKTMETDTLKLHCHQTMTGFLVLVTPAHPFSHGIHCLFSEESKGVKFVVITDPKQGHVDIILKKMYEVYSDFALKNPFYSLDMPIRAELFDASLQSVIEHADKLGISNV